MNTVAVVALVVWALPIVGVVIAYVRLSRRITRELAGIPRNQMIADRAEARQHVARAATEAVFKVDEAQDDVHIREPLPRSRSGRVDAEVLQDRRLFALSTN